MGTYRISQLAARTGVPATALRYYDKLRLLTAARTPAGYRAFSDADAERVRFIVWAKHLGLSLDRIRDLLGVRDGGVCREVRDELRSLVGEQVGVADARLADLRAVRDRLDALLARLAEIPARDGPCGAGCELDARPDEGGPAAPAIACSLDAGARQERVETWHRLIGGAEQDAPGCGERRLRLPARRAGELAALVVAEHECCPFLAFRLTIRADVAELGVRAPDEAEPLLAELFADAPC